MPRGPIPAGQQVWMIDRGLHVLAILGVSASIFIERPSRAGPCDCIMQLPSRAPWYSDMTHAATIELL